MVTWVFSFQVPEIWEAALFKKSSRKLLLSISKPMIETPLHCLPPTHNEEAVYWSNALLEAEGMLSTKKCPSHDIFHKDVLL